MNWQEIKDRALEALDIEAEYAALGITFAGPARANGFRSCYAMGREDSNASAWVYVGNNPAMRGRYGDSGGSGESMGLFDFAATFTAGYPTWKDARDHYIQKAGLARHKPKDDSYKTPDDRIALYEVTLQHFAIITRGLCERYPGVTWQSLARASRKSTDGQGLMLARYPKASQSPTHCVALPCYGPGLIEGGVTGYVLMECGGGTVEIYKGEGNEPSREKRICIGNGMVGRAGIANLKKAKRVTKVEGITDLLVMDSLIPKELRKEHVVITNASGAGEIELPRRFASALKGKLVDVVHDADTPGQDGTGGWRRALAGIAQVRNVELPFQVAEKHGKDLRDWVLT